jgi:hypothetical protein
VPMLAIYAISNRVSPRGSVVREEAQERRVEG